MAWDGNAAEYFNSDHRVPGDKFSKLFLIQVLGPGWPHRKYHVPDLGAGIPDLDFNMTPEANTHLCQKLLRFHDDARSISGIFVPFGWQSKHGPRVAGTQRANHHVVNGVGIFYNHEFLNFAADKLEFGHGGRTVGEQTLTK